MNQVLQLILQSADKVRAAADPIPIGSISFAKGGSLAELTSGISWVIMTIYFIAGTSAIIYFVYSGILYITAAGNPDAAKKGQQGLMYATIGIVVVALSYYLVTTIAAFAVTGVPTR